MTDSKSLKEALSTTNTVEDVSLRVSVAVMREMIRNEEITVMWVPGTHQLADVMTKRGEAAITLLDVLEHGKLPDKT